MQQHRVMRYHPDGGAINNPNDSQMVDFHDKARRTIKPPTKQTTKQPSKFQARRQSTRCRAITEHC